MNPLALSRVSRLPLRDLVSSAAAAWVPARKNDVVFENCERDLVHEDTGPACSYCAAPATLSSVDAEANALFRAIRSSLRFPCSGKAGNLWPG